MIDLFFGLGLVAAGAVVTWRTVRHRRNVRASRDWPTTTGTIATANLTEETERDAEGDLVTTYHFNIQYDYTVSGTTYTGRRVDHGETSTTHRDRASRWAATYHPGNTVTVYYDPADPAASVLETRAQAGSVAGLGIGVAMALWGLVMMAGASPSAEAVDPAAAAEGVQAIQAAHAAAGQPVEVFTSTPEGTPGGADAFVRFHLAYPQGWSLAPDALENGYFLQVLGRPAGQPDSLVTEYLAAFPFTFEGGSAEASEAALAAVAESYAEWLRADNGYANLRITDQGLTSVGPHTAYSLAFDDLGGAGGDAYGRIVLVPAGGSEAGTQRGVGLFLIAYDGSGIERAADVGTEGALAVALASFRLGAPGVEGRG